MTAAKRWFIGCGLLVAFLAGLVTGTRLRIGERGTPAAGADTEIREGRRGFINPLLECEIANERLYLPLRSFGKRLDELIASLEAGMGPSRISVYFRDLNNGPWVGHREAEEFVPASLAKVPIVIACYRHAETNPGFLSTKVVYEGFPQEREPGFLNPENNLQRGRTYTVDELILQVARYSDNAAAKLLAQAIPPRLLESVYFDLGIDPERVAREGFALSPREYGSFFRVLYNASYLSKRFSDQALRAFGQSTFELGLVAGVPDGIIVSHKFGVWEDQIPDAQPFQLHDCGIVYHPQRPYLLCVMTSGTNYVRMAAAIAAVSKLVYEEINADTRRPGSPGPRPDAKDAREAR